MTRATRTDSDEAFATAMRLGRATAAFAALLGILVLIGWAFELGLLKTGLPGYVSMKATTALCFVLLGCALCLLAPKTVVPWQKRIAIALSILTLLLAAATIAEYSSGRHPGVDQMLVRDPEASEGRQGRMAPQTAFSFLLLAASILMIDARTKKGLWPSGALAIVTLLIGLFAVVGYLYGVRALFAVERDTAMAVHTAIGFLLLSCGILLSRAEYRWLQLFFSRNVGGTLTRRLLPIVIFAPLLLGSLQLTGQALGLYGTAFGVAALVVAIILVLFVVVAINAHILDAADRQRRAAEEGIRENEEALQRIMDASADVILTIDTNSVIQRANVSSEAVLGYKPEALVGRSITEVMPPELRERHRQRLQRYQDTGQKTLDWGGVELSAVHKDGRIVPLEVSLGETFLCGRRFFVGFARDISERKRAEQKLRESEERYRSLFESSPQPMWVFDRATLGFLAVNDAAIAHYGYSREEFLAMTIGGIRPAEDLPRFREAIGRLSVGESMRTEEWRHRKKDGTIINVEISAHDFVLDGRPARLVLAIDITEQKRNLAALQVAEARLNLAVEAARTGTFDCNLVDEDLKLSGRCREMLGVLQDGRVSLDTFFSVIHPDDQTRIREALNRSLDPDGTGEFDVEYRVILPDGKPRWVSSKGRTFFEPGPDRRHAARFTGTVIDVTSAKETEERLREQAIDLARSNDDLQQFAYVASHDLQEPLRMVSGYLQLLSRRYKQRLDKDADEFIEFAVDGANRMQQLIRDLLEFSRVGTRAMEFQPVDCARIVDAARRNLQPAIEESGVQITIKPLPVVKGDPTQLLQLFQNLLSNAIKFRTSTDPRVEVFGRCDVSECVLSVRDNGIGIEKEYFERIFMIFQRLHVPGAYPGTGIGLAVCKRIVERHGGHLWVESESGQGSTFHFTLPRPNGGT